MMIDPDEKLCLNDQFIKENVMIHFEMLDLELVGNEYLKPLACLVLNLFWQKITWPSDPGRQPMHKMENSRYMFTVDWLGKYDRSEKAYENIVFWTDENRVSYEKRLWSRQQKENIVRIATYTHMTV